MLWECALTEDKLSSLGEWTLRICAHHAGLPCTVLNTILLQTQAAQHVWLSGWVLTYEPRGP